MRVVSGILLAFVAVPALAEPLPPATPASVGLSAERLELIGNVLRSEIEGKRIPGAVVAIARRGKLAYFEAFGHRDPATGTPMTTDSLFSIASMTKPMATVAALMLYEQGKLLIDDPVAKHLPPIGKMQVAVKAVESASGPPQVETEPPKRAMTIQDLMRHTSGLTYGARGSSLVHKMHPPSSSRSAAAMTGAEFIETLGGLPLIHQPGRVWEYSVSTDVLGLVVEAVAKQSLGAFLQDRLWKPLGMDDTGFVIPEGKRARYAKAFPNDPLTGKPQSVLDSTKPTKFECGGGCAYSAPGDYIRFAQMLLNGGALGDARILSRKTVEYMTADHLGPEVASNVALTDPSRAGYGFGLGVAVRKDTGIAGVTGSKGDYNWGGAFGTYFWVDPKEELAVVFMAHAPGPIRTHYRALMKTLVVQAIVD